MCKGLSAGSSPDEPGRPDMQAIAQFATAQRSDLASTASLVAAIAGFTLAYMAATFYYARELSDNVHRGGALLPAPVWIALTFAAAASIAMRNRMLLLRKVENAIILASQLDHKEQVKRLATKADNVMEPSLSSVLVLLPTVASFAAALGLIVFHTWLFVDLALPDGWWKLAAFVGYALWLCGLIGLLVREEKRIRSESKSAS